MKRYPKYKDSGVTWLGQVPAHWAVKRLKRTFSETTEKAKPEDEQLAATQKYGVISQSQFMIAQEQKLVLALKGTENFKHVEKDDFVISLRAFEGGIERSNQAGCVSPAYTVLRSLGEFNPRFAARLLKTLSFISQISMTYDGIREGKAIKFKDAGPVFLPIPPANEQEAITDFIDCTVGQMDSAIESQERMIELLKERRSAIITQAVTKGLNPNAKMKDSGVPWLGQVPAHWEIKRLRHLGVLTASGIDKISKEGERLVTMINFVDVFNSETKRLKKGDFELMTTTAPEEKARRHQVRRGDILITPSSEESSDIGRSALVDDDFNNTVYSYHLLRFTVSKQNTSPYYLSHFLNSTISLSQLSSVAQGTTRQTLSRSDIKDIVVALPKYEEQIKISEFIDYNITMLNNAIESQERMIELLKERRSAIITQAVTGQIDVTR